MDVRKYQALVARYRGLRRKLAAATSERFPVGTECWYEVGQKLVTVCVACSIADNPDWVGVTGLQGPPGRVEPVKVDWLVPIFEQSKAPK